MAGEPRVGNTRGVARIPRKKLTSKVAAPNLFLCGIGGLLVSLIIVFVFAELRPTQAAVLACLVGLSGSAIATGISGILQIKTKTLVASGPLAVFIVCFWAVMATGAAGALPEFPFIGKKSP
jgi:hypothetical protein